MKLRRNIFPRRLEEILCFLKIGLLLPAGFAYGILVMLPAIHEPGGVPYILTILLGVFLLANIEGNLIACMIIDTSVDQDEIEAEDFEDWKHCSQCDRLSPPRSWHCKLCSVCILRRDHHCMFSGYCIGHQNHRYFMCFLFYLLIASVIYLVYSSIYIWINGTRLFNLLGNSGDSIFPIFFILNLILMVLAIVALGYYVPMLLRGQVFAEGNKNLQDYDNGAKNNLKTVFGQSMKVAWIFPTIRSQLPEDGYTWKKKELKQVP